MSKKAAIALSVVLFILLVILIVCERCWPGAGVTVLGGLLGN